jgi:hypothetical protein
MTNLTKTALTTAYQNALTEARTNPSAETREAAIQASKALSDWVIANEQPKRGPYSSRSNQAGKRQFREHLARHGLTKYLNK